MLAGPLSIAVLMLASQALCKPSAPANITTRAQGIVQYPGEPSMAQQERLLRPQEVGSMMPSVIRVFLTRNVSTDSYRYAAPDVAYHGVLGLGTPGQGQDTKLFNVVFDTGSAESWIPAYNWFPLANNLHYSDGYSCRDSTTCRTTGQEFTIDYRGTRLTGDTYEDMVTLYDGADITNAQHIFGPRSVFSQNFLAMDDASDEQFRYKPYDGVIGLAPVAQSASGTRHLLLSIQQELERQGYSRGPYGYQRNANAPERYEAGYAGYNGYAPNEYFSLMFSFWFNPNQISRHGGQLIIGGVDENLFVGELHFHRVTSWFDWQLSVSSVMLGNQVISCAEGCTAIFDTGANSIVGPRQDVNEIYQEIGARYYREIDMWVVDCDRIDVLPNLMIRFDEIPYMLTSRHYLRLFRHSNKAVCALAIKPWDRPGWLLGTHFLSAYYTAFDFAGRRIGLATPRASFAPYQ